jgi:hypothetical protein
MWNNLQLNLKQFKKSKLKKKISSTNTKKELQPLLPTKKNSDFLIS